MSLPSQTEIFVTADGSPTLSYKREDGYAEKMHHSGGAFSESVYIYLEALKLNPSPSRPRVFSVGLGLAYNEMLAVGWFTQQQITDFEVWSFESVAALRDGFRLWLEGDDQGPLAETYNLIEERTARHFELKPGAVREALKAALKSSRLHLQNSFPDDRPEARANVIFYDAYSRKMNAELWDERILTESLEPVLEERCILATYAATGSLNRALKHLGFRLIEKAGFQGKRESTLAIRD